MCLHLLFVGETMIGGAGRFREASDDLEIALRGVSTAAM